MPAVNGFRAKPASRHGNEAGSVPCWCAIDGSVLRQRMKLYLHHINLSTTQVGEMDAFYRDVLGLDRETQGLPRLEKKKGYAGDVAFVTDGRIQMHLAARDIGAGFRTGQIVNPVARGHIAYRTDDLEAFKAHLDTNGIPYSDWGDRAVAGWHQIFFYDPDGNVIEVHQITDATAEDIT